MDPGSHTTGIRSLFLLNGALFPESYRPRPIQRWLAGPLGPLLVRFLRKERALDRLAEVFGPATRPDLEEREAFWALIAANDGLRALPGLLGYMREREQNRERWVAALTGSPVPVMFVNGTIDPVSGSEMAARWRVLLPEAPIVELERVGHYPQLEDPEAVLEACLPFLASAAFT